MLPAVAEDFGVSLGTAGLTLGLYSLAYAVGQFFYGQLGDRVGRVRVIRSVLIFFGVCTWLCAAAPSIEALLGLRLLTGLAGAAIIPLSLAYLGDTIEDHAARQRAIGIFLSSLISGFVLGQVIGGLLAGFLDWQAIFVLIGALSLLLAAAMWSFLLPAPTVVASTGSLGFGQIIRTDRPLFLLAMCETFLFLGALSYAAASLVEEHGASYPLAGALMALFALGSFAASGGLARIAAGAADATRVRIGASVMAAGFAILATIPGVPLFGGAVLMLGFGFTVAHSTLQTRITGVDPQSRGMAVSLFAGLANVGAGVGALAAGAAVDAFGFGVPFAAAALGLLVLVAITRRCLEPRRESGGRA